VCGEEFELLGCYAKRDREGEPCCSDSCEAKHRWRGGPEAFGRPAKGGTPTTCAEPGCGREFYRYPSRPDQRFCPDHANKARAAYHASDAAKAEHERGAERLQVANADFLARREAKKAELGGAIDTGRMAAVIQGLTGERGRELHSSPEAVVTYWIGKRGPPAEPVYLGRRPAYLAKPREFGEWWRALTGSTAVIGRLNRELAAEYGAVVGRRKGAPAKPRVSKLTDEQKAEIDRHAAEGQLSQQAIANAVGAKRGQVRRHLGRG
jgi:hypothetical protein